MPIIYALLAIWAISIVVGLIIALAPIILCIIGFFLALMFFTIVGEALGHVLH